ncbi:bleomycin resistance protein [Kordiimonas sp.]|uniref:bleomycin resistance protein n=1 Tax=Kordiimonas sp. TaxID=1970157 RepID=UPI003A9331E5
MNEQRWNALVPEFSVTDFGRSLAFYTNILGFSIQHQRTEPDFAYLDLEGAQIMLEQLSGNSWATGDMTPPLGRGVNFQIEISDLQPILQRLKAVQHPLFSEPEDEWYETEDSLSGQREFLVVDPDGYLLRFCQFLGEKPLES